MFRLHLLSLKGHPILHDVDLTFYEEEKETSIEDPFTSVLIGMNGTGKSFILKTIGDLFFEIESFITSKTRDSIPFQFQIRYSINKEIFDIVSSQGVKVERIGKVPKNVVGIFALKDRPINYPIYPEKLSFGVKDDYEIKLNEALLPSRVLVSTSQLNDRFTFKKDDQSNFYKYCGVKRTARNISTNAFKRNIADSLLVNLDDPHFQEILGNALSEYLGFDTFLNVHFRTKYTSNFFHGDLTIENLIDFYLRYEETGKRKTEPWGSWKFKQLFNDHEEHYEKKERNGKQELSDLETLINYVNSLKPHGHLAKVDNTDSKRLSIDIFNTKTLELNGSILTDLQQLDLIYLEWIELQKNKLPIDLDKTSAGENQIIMSLLSVLSKIEEDSLVLIDEPEISLHPNWQMAYIDLLKGMFSKFSNSHFIIATHSHFIISDLKPDSSSVISLRRDNENKLNVENLEADTFGWSAEDILYRVFEVKTNRNFYIEQDLRVALSMMSSGQADRNRLIEILERLNALNLNTEDPLNLVIDKIEKFIEQ